MFTKILENRLASINLLEEKLVKDITALQNLKETEDEKYLNSILGVEEIKIQLIDFLNSYKVEIIEYLKSDNMSQETYSNTFLDLDAEFHYYLKIMSEAEIAIEQ